MSKSPSSSRGLTLLRFEREGLLFCRLRDFGIYPQLCVLTKTEQGRSYFMSPFSIAKIVSGSVLKSTNDCRVVLGIRLFTRSPKGKLLEERRAFSEYIPEKVHTAMKVPGRIQQRLYRVPSALELNHNYIFHQCL